ncbi:CoA transferase [Alcaligenaceae bacterium]|nr:CoA transferase [Alcaligenaceae bacterium]
MLPLTGYRILDLTSVIFGPLASQVMADYGADVIKIESPDGDVMRGTGPTTENGMGAVFLGVNRGKRSIIIDLKSSAGREALLNLVSTADVLMHTIRPQKLAAIGLDEQLLRQHNPKLVFASLVGFGENGPYSGMPAYDDIIQGKSGNVDLMQRQTGTPQYFPSIVADKTSGLIAVSAILAALLARERTGKGSHVEIPMFESMVAFNLVEHLYGRHFDPAQGAAGYSRVLNPWRRPFRTTDGFICALPYTEAHWRRFFEETDVPDLIKDPRFNSHSARTHHAEALYAVVGKSMATRSTDEWLKFFKDIDVAASRITSMEDLQKDEHLLATEFFQTIHDEAMGKLVFPGVPVRFDGVRPAVGMAPRLGEHTAEVLAEIKQGNSRRQ